MLWIERHTHHYPLTLHSVQNSYHEAMKSHDFFGDSKHGFCDRFALGIEFSTGFGLHAVRPRGHRIGVFGASGTFAKRFSAVGLCDVGDHWAGKDQCLPSRIVGS